MSLKKLSSKLAWTAAFLLTAINTYSFADRQLPSIMIPELKAELLLTDAQIGFLFGTVFAIFFGIATLIFGRLADTPSRKNVLIFAIVMWSVLTGLCGIAQQFWDLIIFRIGVGVGEAALGPIALVVLSAYFTREKLPLALGIWGAGPFLGSALAGWGGAAMITNMDKIKTYFGFLSEFSDWRLTFFLFAIPGLIFALLLKFLPFPEITTEKKDEAEFMPFFKKAWKFFILMFVGVTITGLVGYSVLAWGIEMLVRVHDIPKTTALALQLPMPEKEIWLRRWRNAEDPLFHPRTPVDGNGLLTALEIEPGPRLGRLLHHLKLEHAFGRIQTPSEALKEAQHFLTRESEAL